jgi:hypothetical protein
MLKVGKRLRGSGGFLTRRGVHVWGEGPRDALTDGSDAIVALVINVLRVGGS